MNKTKETTIYDIAKALDLSPSTISRGLNNSFSIPENTRLRICRKATELGYRSNFFAGLRNKRTSTIGMIVPEVNTYFMSNILAGVEMTTNERGYNLVVRQSAKIKAKEIYKIRTLFGNRIDGLLISIDAIQGGVFRFNAIAMEETPIYFIGDYSFPISPFKNIAVDHFAAAYELTKHFFDQGCKKIAFVAPHLESKIYTDLLKGYKNAMVERHHSFQDDLLVIDKRCEHSGAGICSNLLATKTLPDGVLFSSDISAAMCMKELLSSGIRIPEDICIAGFGNDPLCKLTEPKLTSVNFPAIELGRVAASNLIQLLENEKNTSLATVSMPHELIVRSSSSRVVTCL